MVPLVNEMKLHENASEDFGSISFLKNGATTVMAALIPMHTGIGEWLRLILSIHDEY